MHVFWLDDGQLRPCRGGECTEVAQTESLSGTRIQVELFNACSVAVAYVVWAAPAGERPPPQAPVHTLEAGARETMEIDAAQWIRPLHDGEPGGGVRLDHDGTVRFDGDGCRTVSAHEGDTAN